MTIPELTGVRDPHESLLALRDGNHRFAAGLATVPPPADDFDQASAGSPLAIVLSCSDARVPVNLVFDCGVGDLFAVRVAGNIAAPTQIDSMEFGARRLGIRLVVVLGHSHCGAVTLAIEELQKPRHRRSTRRPSITGLVRPAVKPLISRKQARPPDELLRQAVRANVRSSVSAIRTAPGLRRAVNSGRLVVVGAEYALNTRQVTFHREDWPAASLEAGCG